MATVSAQARDGLSFGPFNLIASERLLTRDGLPIELGARAFDILIALISAPNEVVSKKELMSRVWPDVIVEEGSLRFHMASLRKALGDGKDGARYTTTLSGRGYCFVAPVLRAIGTSAVATEQRVQRRLAAIMAVDVVGYSALMQSAEEATYAEFQRLKCELIEPACLATKGASSKLRAMVRSPSSRAPWPP